MGFLQSLDSFLATYTSEMLPRFINALFAPRVVYIGGRFSTLIVSFFFSIIYSRLLGLENRAVLTFIFTIVSLLVLGFTASLGLSLRERISRTRQTSLELAIFFKNLFSLTVTLLCFFNFSLFLYSQIIGYLSFKIYLVASLLLISSSFIQGMNDCLVAIDRFRTVMFFEIAQVILQIICFIALEHIFDLSFINAVMLAITSTYFASGVVIITLLWKSGLISFKENLANLQVNFITYSKVSIRVVLPTILIDRVDKLLIAIFLPLATLSQYSILLTFVSLFRFIPESVSKMYFSRHKINFQIHKLRTIPILIFILACIGFGYIPYRLSTSTLLGEEWVAPLDIFLLVGFYELVRGIYVVSINRNYASDKFKVGNFLPSTALLVFLCVLLPFIFLGFLGVNGIPIGLTLGYLLVLFLGPHLQERSNYSK
jgi:O-antigen/teichoic acid export membrane protein